MLKNKKIKLFVNGSYLGQYDLPGCCKVAKGMDTVSSMSFVGDICCFIES